MEDLHETENGEDENGEKEEEWSKDVDNLISDDGFDDMNDNDDDSSENDNDLPPDFDEDAELLEIGQGKTIKLD
ncbi:hypothetical protein VNO78_35516 [Psophocarpus tetragonolobus]|uniref:Uncharacterized protein n=1 Tax=Psophocarpus tetragonolobus TaxID=3891 RepID=A0AAN9NTK6_PSOTE